MKVIEMTEGGGETAIIATEHQQQQQQEMAGAQDTIYLCNFRVSVDGEWLCLKELQDVEFNMQDSLIQPLSSPSPEIVDRPFGKEYVESFVRFSLPNFILTLLPEYEKSLFT